MLRMTGLAMGSRSGGGVLLASAYFLLGLGDMALSSTAFRIGVPEANPAMAWLAANGLFEPSKLLLTAAIAALIVRVHGTDAGRGAAWFAVAIMSGVAAYHVWGLRVLGCL